MAILRGNLAPRGAVIKHSAASPDLLQHTGRAVVFESVEDLRDPDRRSRSRCEADDMLVLRNAGPKGAPGMPEAGYLPIPQKLAQAGVKDMVRISDARMSGTAFGTIVLHIAPEAADGWAARRSCAAATGSASMCRRGVSSSWSTRTSWSAAPRNGGRRRTSTEDQRGYRALYLRSVLQADEGCDFDFLRGRSGPAVARASGDLAPALGEQG